MINHVLFPVPSAELGKGILVSQTYHGNLLLGPTSRGSNDASLTNQEIIETILQSARLSVPGFDVRRAITSYSGLRAKSDRGDFIIEEHPRVRHFINVAGVDSPGLTSSPAVALLVVDIVRRAGLQLAPKASFQPQRRAIIVPKDDSFTGEIDCPDPTRNIICRCESVTEAEIVDAVHRPLPSHSTDMIKRRTRAGMGRCQGAFCEPRVARIIARETGVLETHVTRRRSGSS